MKWDEFKSQAESEPDSETRSARSSEHSEGDEPEPPDVEQKVETTALARLASPAPDYAVQVTKSRKPPSDSRSVGRPPRLELWSVLWRTAEGAGQTPTEVAQEARIAYLLIIITFLVDWSAWFVLVFGLFRNFIANQLLGSGPETGIAVNTVIPGVACAILGSLYPLAFALYEVNFYRSDLSREGSRPIDIRPEFFNDNRRLGLARNIAMLSVILILLLLVSFGTVLIQLPNAIEVSLWVILFVVFLMGVYRFGAFIGFVFGVRSIIIVLAAYVTSYPLEMMIYRERINEVHIKNKREELTNRISLRISSLGVPPPRSFDLFKIDTYLNAASREAGTIHSRYSLCFSTKMQRILGRRTLREVGELDAEKSRLENSLRCANICSTRVLDAPGQIDLDRCLSQLDKEYPDKGSGGLRAVCLPKVGLLEERRLSGVRAWISARKDELADTQSRLGPIAIADVAEAHTSCLESPSSGGLPPAAQPKTQSSGANEQPALLPLGEKSLAHDIGVVDAWRPRLVVTSVEGREVLALDARYQPHLCSDATREEKQEGFCIDAPGLSEQILIMTTIQGEKENKRARAFALFIAMVLPLLVILNKLLASEELHSSLSRTSERSTEASLISKDVLMGTVLSRDTSIQRREQALLRLFELSLLGPRDFLLIEAQGEPDLIKMLHRLYRS